MILSNNLSLLTDYLHSIDFLEADETIEQATVPGDGNMNFTLRLTTGQRSFIVKQSRDYVEKYPHVPAPASRAMQEYAFYSAISGDRQLTDHTPHIYHADAENNVLVMEDLGVGADFTHYYEQKAEIKQGQIDPFVDFLIQLHSEHELGDEDQRIHNTEMRQLNHQHMYVYPMLDDNGLDLDAICSGLQEVATALRQNQAITSAMTELGQLYLADGSTLLHGDYFLGSWLAVGDKDYVIDPEFCHHGKKEFEVGVMIAHLLLARQTETLVDYCTARYREEVAIDLDLAQAFAGGEIIRRLLGLAQLPLNATLEERISLLNTAQTLLLR